MAVACLPMDIAMIRLSTPSWLTKTRLIVAISRCNTINTLSFQQTIALDSPWIEFWKVSYFLIPPTEILSTEIIGRMTDILLLPLSEKLRRISACQYVWEGSRIFHSFVHVIFLRFQQNRQIQNFKLVLFCIQKNFKRHIGSLTWNI
jgi:hypothetical protein